jgi:hypothetical protein
MIGDSLIDVEGWQTRGCKAALLAENGSPVTADADTIGKSLNEALARILETSLSSVMREHRDSLLNLRGLLPCTCPTDSEFQWEVSKKRQFVAALRRFPLRQRRLFYAWAP